MIFENKLFSAMLALAPTLRVLALCRSQKFKIRSQIHLLNQALTLA